MKEHPMLSLEEALERLHNAISANPPNTEMVALDQADGRVLACDMISPLSAPPQACSAMDGYAVRAREITHPGCTLGVSQRIAAGAAAAPLQEGTVARIFTGAAMPGGADTVVMQEDTQTLAPSQVRFDRIPTAGQHVRAQGEDLQRGSLILRRGERLGPASLGLAASMGQARLCVASRPQVALLCTGDELVSPGTIEAQDLPVGHIFESNRFFLGALLKRLGAKVDDAGLVPDRFEATLEALSQAARDNDLIITSGGVSVGEEDHVKPALEKLGRMDLWRVAIKPGKPFAFGQIPRPGRTPCYFAGLPGNPVSALVTFLLLVRPLLLYMQGAAPQALSHMPLRADFEWPRPGARREFLRVRRNSAGALERAPNQGSAVLTALHWADGLVDLPAGCTVAKGDLVNYLPLSEMLS